MSTLITLEGLDGSGKSTICESLQNILPEVTFTREPTDSWYGDLVTESMYNDDADSLAELFLFTADHAAHLSRVIRPSLASGTTVISDRYADSRFAYQAAALDNSRIDAPLEYIQSIHEPFSRRPDATIYLDIDPETAVTRAGATNKFERVQYLERVATQYEQLIAAEPTRFYRVDATQSIVDVKEDVNTILRTILDDETSTQFDE
ncbi:MAG: thymidylate kinase [Haloquadratum walsbyi J07HQW1]|jgi:dTMP kinase|uniref:Probable thymidylate kinase n=1 Tax=Haloquadratum walsbyi J07HQW1 TaxID=1238424 RepID=U1PM25_9EURY|nr:MAG: thymidylate kinase [Haloquadratum walsbyi J07HQW1]